MIAYFDCFSGISGDMLLGALADLGVSAAWLEQSIARLPLDGFSLKAQPIMRNGIRAIRMHVECAPGPPHRRFADIRDMIEQSPFSPWVRQKALDVFGRLAAAEGWVHGVDPEKVHFHEVGSTDAIVDVLGAVLGLERLGVERVVCSALPLGSGFVKCRHGVLPVPAPAVVELVKGLPSYGADTGCELVTPTGAALAAALAGEFGPYPAMEITRVGYGAGLREIEDRPNLLRVLLAMPMEDSLAGAISDCVEVIESNIDDMPPELFGHLMDRLFAAGALDVVYLPAFMKKNRPACLVQIICEPGKRNRILALLFAESSTSGARFHTAQRKKLLRRPTHLSTPWGPVDAKEIILPDGGVRITPEYESCRRLALEKGVPLADVYLAAQGCGRKK